MRNVAPSILAFTTYIIREEGAGQQRNVLFSDITLNFYKALSQATKKGTQFVWDFSNLSTTEERMIYKRDDSKVFFPYLMQPDTHQTTLL